MDKGKIATLSEAVGQRLRTFRERAHIRQEDIAASARHHGLHRWRRSTVAAIELGQRELSFTEAALLPLVLYAAGLQVELAELLPEKGDLVIASYPSETGDRTVRRSLPARAVRGALSGAGIAAARQLKKGFVHSVALISPENLAALGDTEVKVAARLGMTPLALTQAALRLWGRSLSDERERRVAEQETKHLDQRSLQALRGHATRALLIELGNAME